MTPIEKTKAEWLRKFDELFNDAYFVELVTEMYYGDVAPKKLKDFISSLIDSVYKQGVEDCIEKLPKGMNQSYCIIMDASQCHHCGRRECLEETEENLRRLIS